METGCITKLGVFYILTFSLGTVSSESCRIPEIQDSTELLQPNYTTPSGDIVVSNNPTDVVGCVWRIGVRRGFRVQISVRVTGTLYASNTSADLACLTTNVVAKDGITGSNQSFCVQPKQQEWTSDSNLVEITVSGTMFIRFQLHYETVCGSQLSIKDLTNTNGIQASSVPLELPVCSWTLVVPLDTLAVIDESLVPSCLRNREIRPTRVWELSPLENKDFYCAQNKALIKANFTLTFHRLSNVYEKPWFNLDLGIPEHPCTTSSPCSPNGVCHAQTAEPFYRCVCVLGYTGVNCNKKVCDGPCCLAEDDTIYNIQWPNTAAGKYSNVSCPDSAVGYATRHCKVTDDGAQWEIPDLTTCVSQEILNIASRVDVLQNKTVIDHDDVTQITSSISDTFHRGEQGKKTIYPGDLLATTDIVKNLADVTKQLQEHSDVDQVAQEYNTACSSLVADHVIPTWKMIDVSQLEKRMTSLLSSLVTLADNVAHLRLKSHSTSGRRKREISELSKNLTISTIGQNVEFNVTFHERIAICEEKQLFQIGRGNYSNTLVLPSDAFRNAVENSLDSLIPVYTGRFSSISNILSEEGPQENNTFAESLVNSDVVSANILGVSEDFFSHLKQSVVITLAIKNSSYDNKYRPTCSFLNMSARHHVDRWSTQGCSRDEAASNKSHVVCRCSHLTNFAVLMDVYEIEPLLDENNNDALTYISYAGGALSILCCIVSIIIFEFFRLRKERIRIHEQLAISIILVQALFMGGIDRTENKGVCMAMAICLHYALTSLFCWMLVEGFHLYILLVKVFKRANHLIRYLLFGWGLPLIIVGISVGVFHDQYGNEFVCWMSSKLLFYVFVPAVGLVILTNSFILLMVLRTMVRSLSTKSSNSDERSTVKAGVKAAVILLPLLGLTWTLGFLSIDNKEALIFTYLFTLCNSLQGVFFFVFHCLLNIDVQKAYTRRSERRSTVTWTYFTEKNARQRKNSDVDTYYSNASKESINSSSTYTSTLSLDRKRKMNGMDRIYRDAKITDGFGVHLNLHRSQSDDYNRKSTGLPRTEIEDGIQYHNVYSGLHGLTFYKGRNSVPNTNLCLPDDQMSVANSTKSINPPDDVNEVIYSQPHALSEDVGNSNISATLPVTDLSRSPSQQSKKSVASTVSSTNGNYLSELNVRTSNNIPMDVKE